MLSVAEGELLLDGRRAAAYQRIGWDIAGDDGTRRNHTSLPQSDTGKDQTADPYPNPIFDGDRFGFRARPHPPGTVPEIVCRGIEFDIRTDRDIAPDKDLSVQSERNSLCDNTAFSDVKPTGDIAGAYQGQAAQ